MPALRPIEYAPRTGADLEADALVAINSRGRPIPQKGSRMSALGRSLAGRRVSGMSLSGGGFSPRGQMRTDPDAPL